jgi:hypothetical protein
MKFLDAEKVGRSRVKRVLRLARLAGPDREVGGL